MTSNSLNPNRFRVPSLCNTTKVRSSTAPASLRCCDEYSYNGSGLRTFGKSRRLSGGTRASNAPTQAAGTADIRKRVISTTIAGSCTLLCGPRHKRLDFPATSWNAASTPA